MSNKTVSREPASNRTVEIIVGLAIFAIVVVGAYYGVHKLYDVFSPTAAPVQVSLSAYFDGGQLKLNGEVLQGTQPVANGKVRLVIVNLRGNFDQSFFVDLKNDGAFSRGAGELPALNVLRQNDPIQISAEIHPARSPQVYTTTIYLNSNAPTQLTRPVIMLLATLGIMLFIAVVVFFWAFTGPASLTKDRAAIILSYCVIIAFLALPIGSGILLGSGLGPDSMYTAVGLIVTKVPQKDATQPNESQWALNIGGFVSPLADVAQPATTAVPTVAAAAQTGNAAVPPAASGSNATPAVGSRPAGATAGGQSPSGASSIPDLPSVTLHPWQAQEVHVDGGLVIPLYVVLLSIMGGAINMTRKVPDIQGQAPASYPSFFKRVKSYFRKTDEPSGKTTTTRGEEVTELVNPPTVESQPPVALTKTEPSADNNKLPEQPASVDDEDQDQTRTEKWRVGLLNLYMYLISAPFLAIVTYYLLWWLDLTKVPILVLVSFSIGLMSDKIVDKLLSVVQGWMSSSSTDSGGGVGQTPVLPKS